MERLGLSWRRLCERSAFLGALQWPAGRCVRLTCGAQRGSVTVCRAVTAPRSRSISLWVPWSASCLLSQQGTLFILSSLSAQDENGFWVHGVLPQLCRESSLPRFRGRQTRGKLRPSALSWLLHRSRTRNVLHKWFSITGVAVTQPRYHFSVSMPREWAGLSLFSRG